MLYRNIERSLLHEIHGLPPVKIQEVLDFVRFLKYTTTLRLNEHKLEVFAEDRLRLEQPSKRRSPSARIARKGRILGDIMSPVVAADDWDALK